MKIRRPSHFQLRRRLSVIATTTISYSLLLLLLLLLVIAIDSWAYRRSASEVTVSIAPRLRIRCPVGTYVVQNLNITLIVRRMKRSDKSDIVPMRWESGQRWLIRRREGDQRAIRKHVMRKGFTIRCAITRAWRRKEFCFAKPRRRPRNPGFDGIVPGQPTLSRKPYVIIIQESSKRRVRSLSSVHTISEMVDAELKKKEQKKRRIIM